MKKKWIRKEDCFAFLLPLIAMLIIFIGKGIFPFGKESFLRTDLYHQYAPFLRAFQAKLQSLGTFSYSFDVGLGVNFRALQAFRLPSTFESIFGEMIMRQHFSGCFMLYPDISPHIPGM